MNRNTGKIVNIIIALVLVVSLYKLITVAFSVSYPYGEEYEIQAGNNTVIQAIDRFKEAHPEYKVPDTLTLQGGKNGKLEDGRRDSSDEFYHAYFYYAKENEIIKTWVKKVDSNNTILAFDAVNAGLVVGNWKGVLKDYPDKEKAELKSRFEARILNPVKQMAERKE